MSYFLDPVFINNFCRPCLSLCWQARADHDHRSEKQICVTHQEAKGLFCEADQTLFRGLCSERPGHAAHSHSPIHTAAEKKVMITAEYQRIHILLQEEEQPHLEGLKKERERLKAIYRELTGMCHKLDTELLQGLENVLETTDLAEMQKCQPMNPELPSWPVSEFLHMLNNFSVNNVLSQTTTVHHAILNDASVISEDDHPGVSRQPRGSGGSCVVARGAQAFTAGRHYWELDMRQSSSWILGVCKSILTSDTSISTGAEEAFFLFSTKVNSQYILSTTFPPLVQFVKRPLGKIGVFLDDDNGTVSFCEVFRNSLIYSFLPLLFSSPLIPFLCLKFP
ncbi:hypothetical protein FD755_009874 [Muntiacus reevesi]|uniref:B30.2/SPRY domain-containing protein n=1 Tax=Muntiacus reevesi TaxID=9886 RepID=A0A5N3Y055_MUNRE|nr:hypothetical protein FD755_009874 [Muntiacus reevesi]